ncbi:MAG: HigA family addiction module antitoxin [Pseudomonadota bacterium]
MRPPPGISQNMLARNLDVPVARINDIVHARSGIAADTALRLAACLSTTAEMWLSLRARYDVKVIARPVGAEIKRSAGSLRDRAA